MFTETLFFKYVCGRVSLQTLRQRRQWARHALGTDPTCSKCDLGFSKRGKQNQEKEGEDERPNDSRT